MVLERHGGQQLCNPGARTDNVRRVAVMLAQGSLVWCY
jgi:hypothetical protein